MASYLIKKNNQTGVIIFVEYELSGYKFKPSSNKRSLRVKEVTIVKPKLIEKILEVKFDKALKKVLDAAFDALNKKEANDEINQILKEIEKLKQILKNKYQKFLSKEKEKSFLAKLELLEHQLTIKLKPEIDFEKVLKTMLAKIILIIDNDDATEEDTAAVINEIARLRIVLQNYSEKEIKKNDYYLEKIEKLEKKLLTKRCLLQEKEIISRISSSKR